jgi:hypothetical protein
VLCHGMIRSEISVERPFRLEGTLFFWHSIVVAHLVHFCIAFARDSQNHEATSAPHGALFNAYSFLKTSTMLWAQAIQSVIFFSEDSMPHCLYPRHFNSHDYIGSRLRH